MTGGPLHVVLVGPARFPVTPPYAGGLEAFIGTLARELRTRGHHVEVVAGVRPPAPRDDRRADVPHDEDDLIADGEALRREVERRVDRTTVLHLNAPSIEVLDLVDAVAHVEVTLHTPPLDHFARLCELRDRVGISTPSRSNAAQWSSRFDVDPAVIGNGVDRATFRPGARRGAGLFWAGRLVPEKGAHLAIEAARLLEVPVRIAGPVHDQQYFDDAVRPLLGRGATYLGHLRPDELARQMAGASATLVTPLWPEPFGLVVAESLACGTPVAAFANGALRGDGSGPFPPDVVITADRMDAQALAHAAIRAVGASRSRCRQASREFDLIRTVERYEQRYRAGSTDPCATSSASTRR